MEAMIDMHGIVKTFKNAAGEVTVLKGIDLTIYRGEFVSLVGKSGSGKSTLLNMITGIDHPSDGRVVVNGQDLHGMGEDGLARWRGTTVGVIFQFFQLLPTLTVLENVILPMDFARKWKPSERPERAKELLEQVELAHTFHKLPSTLSGGEQQRAAIARALANDPPLLVGDEPTGNLDSQTADTVFTLFQRLVEEGKTFLMVTHSNSLAQRIPRVIEVLDGQLYENGARPKR
jgi:putative ABC transport system ATP-binding protein